MPPAEESQLNRTERAERRWTAAVFLAAAALRIYLALAAPAWGSPDEYPHYWVADHLARTGSWPDFSFTFPNYEAFQPPLHYALTAGILRLTDQEGSVPEFRDSTAFPPPAAQSIPASLITLRFFSVLLGLLTLLIAWRTLKEMPTLTNVERISSLAFIAFLPTYVGTTAGVNNDALAVLISALAIRYAIRKDPSRRDLLFAGLAAGFALLTKTSTVVILPVFLFLLIRSYRASKRGERSFASTLLLLCSGAAVGLGALIARNLLQYGSITAIMPTVDRTVAADPANIMRAVRNLFWSFWVAFGRTYDLRPPDLFYPLLFLPLSLIALVGVLRSFRRYGEVLQLGVASLLFGIVVSIGFTISFPTGSMTSWGKNLYPLLPLIAPMVVIGWNNAAGRGRRFPAIVGLILLFLFSLWGCGQMLLQ